VREAAAQTEPSESSDVNKRFAEAVRLYKEGDAARALPLFEQLLAETDSPNANLYVGHCLVKLARYVEAYRAYSTTVSATVERNDSKYEPTKDAARAQLAALDLRVAKLVIALAELPTGIQVTIDGEELDPGRIGTPVILEPGDHVVVATAEGMTPVRRNAQVKAGETRTLALALRSREEKSEPEPDTAPSATPDPAARHRSLATLGWAGAGIGIAGVSVFAVAGLRAKSIHDALEESCGEQPCTDAAHHEDASQGKTMQTVANTGLLVGAVGAAAGTFLLLRSRSQRSTEAALSLSPEGATLTCRGTFR
jgi:hypothetical protein